ncbi:MAG: hypothetical protein F6K58_08805 [Symploca sp. SIO2E9]|nr:hypothetical protein [Symploca sp. SIO2E9]
MKAELDERETAQLKPAAEAVSGDISASLTPQDGIPIPKVTSSSPRKINHNLVAMAFGAALLVVMGGTAAVVTRTGSSAKSPQQGAIEVAQKNMFAERNHYIEKLTRTDLNPQVLSNPGWRQQAIAMLSQVIAEDISRGRRTPGDPMYMKTQQAAYLDYQKSVNKLAYLAELGQTATLVYEERGREVRIPIPSPELATFALNRLEALDMATHLKMVPRFNLQIVNTELANVQHSYKLRLAAWLEQMQMYDSAEQIRAIRQWEQQQIEAAQPTTQTVQE